MNKLLTTIAALVIATTCGASQAQSEDHKKQGNGEQMHRLDTFTGVGRREDFEAAMVHERKAWAAFRNENYDMAIKHFREATGVYDNLPGAYWGIGMSLEKTGDLAGAEAAYRSSLKYNTDQYRVWKRLASILYGEKKYEESRKAVANALSLQPPPKERRELEQMIRSIEAGSSGQ